MVSALKICYSPFVFALFFLLITPRVSAQHDHEHMDHMNMDMPMDDDSSMMHMSHSFSQNLPMSRNGSGTAWLPDASPMYGKMIHTQKWMFMLHGSAFVRYNSQDFTKKGVRGGDRWDIPNWIMLMGQRKIGTKGLFHFSAMLSLDAAIVGGKGYPLLFQTGEAYKGNPLIDRQHPHDFFSELAVSYTHAFSKKTDVFVYLGYPGEPALGPVTFMHRPSSLDNPNAPISHHWVDATHITFGVATLGIRQGRFKLDGSLFTGREPDEHRFDFDKPKFDSWSSRLSFNPSKNFALQISHGYVKSPEELHPEENVHKTTASVEYGATTGKRARVNATALWGLNKVRGHGGENAFLAEGSLHTGKNAVYVRYEFVQKSAEELVLHSASFSGHDVFNVNELTAGYNRDLFDLGKIRVAAGANYTVYAASSRLDALYGSWPSSVQVYLRFYPTLM